MRLISLEAANFKHLRGSSEGEPFRVEFGEGVLGVRGPNESGKSSLMQAVFFALTGSPMEGGREIGQYVGYGATRAKVSLEFEVGGRRYLVARTIQRIQGSLDRGRSDARLIELGPNGSRRTVCTGTREVNAKIREMLGNLGPEELRSTVFIIQKDLDRLKEKKPHERRELIDSLIGRESFDKAKEALAERRRELEGTPQRRGLIAEARAELERLLEKLSAFKKASAELSRVRERIRILGGPAEVAGSVREAEARRDAIKGDLAALREYGEYLNQRSDLQRRIGIEEERLKGIKTELEHLRENVSKLRDYESHLKEVEAGIAKIVGPPTEPESLAHAEARRDEISRIVSSLKDLQGALRDRAELIDRISGLEADLAKKSEELGDIRSRIAELQSKLQGLRRRLGELRERRDALKARAAALTRVSQVLFGLGAAVLLLSFLTPAVSHTLAGVPIALALAVWYYASKPREEYRGLEGMVPALEEQERSVERQLEQAQRQEAAASEEMVDLRRKIEESRRRLEEVALRVKSLLESLGSRDIDLPEEVSGPEDVDPTLSVWEERLKEANAEVIRREEERRSLLKEANRLRGEIEKVKDAPKQVEEKTKELKRVSENLRRLREELESLVEPELPDHLRPYSDDLLRSYQEAFIRASEEVASRKKELEGLRGREKELEEELKSLEGIEERVKEAEDRLKELERELKVVKLAIRLLEDSAEATRKSIRPAIEFGMSTILPVITGWRYGRVRIDEESFDVSVYDSDAGTYVKLDRFSGGTVDQVLLAMRLAFTLSVIPKMRGTHPEFLFMDEVLASSDADRRRQIMELVAKNLRRSFAQIVVISHQEDVLRHADRHLVLREGEVVGSG